MKQKVWHRKRQLKYGHWSAKGGKVHQVMQLSTAAVLQETQIWSSTRIAASEWQDLKIIITSGLKIIKAGIVLQIVSLTRKSKGRDDKKSLKKLPDFENVSLRCLECECFGQRIFEVCFCLMRSIVSKSRNCQQLLQLRVHQGFDVVR